MRFYYYTCARLEVTWSFVRAINSLFTLPRTQNVLGEKGRRIRELTAVVQKRFGFPEGSVEVSGAGQRQALLRTGNSASGWCF